MSRLLVERIFLRSCRLRSLDLQHVLVLFVRCRLVSALEAESAVQVASPDRVFGERAPGAKRSIHGPGEPRHHRPRQHRQWKREQSRGQPEQIALRLHTLFR